MKVFISFVLLFCLVFPVFSQNSNSQRFRTLGDAMNTTLSKNRDALADFDSRALDDGSIKRYTEFLRLHRDLSKALSDSEFKLNFLLNAHAHVTEIKNEHQNFQDLIKSMEELKKEYDSWMSSVK